jgi:ATP-dependent DNA helicase RecQ
MTYLELEGILQPTSVVYTEYKFKPQRPSAEILARFDADRARFVGSLSKQSRPGRTWFWIDVTQAALVLSEPRQRLVAALEYLDQQGDIVLQTAGVRHLFRVLKRPPNHQDLVETLVDKFELREEQDIARIHNVIELVESPGCLTQTLLAYFGEERPPCGHCDRCADATLDRRPYPGRPTDNRPSCHRAARDARNAAPAHAVPVRCCVPRH